MQRTLRAVIVTPPSPTITAGPTGPPGGGQGGRCRVSGRGGREASRARGSRGLRPSSRLSVAVILLHVAALCNVARRVRVHVASCGFMVMYSTYHAALIDYIIYNTYVQYFNVFDLN